MKEKAEPMLSIVIPVYCEGGDLSTVLGEITAVLDRLGDSYEIVLVDDGSPDDTWTVIEQQSKTYRPRLRALKLSRNFGKESALVAGLEAARGQGVIVMDGDLQHPPSIIPEMVRLWRESDADIVEAVKESRGKETLFGKAGALCFYAALNKLSGFDLRGATDFKLMDRCVVDAWLKMGERNLFYRGMVAWLGFNRTQVPFSVPERVGGGKSRWSPFQLVQLALTGLTAYSSLPLHLVTLLGTAFLGFAVLGAVVALLLKILTDVGDSLTTIIFLILIQGSVLMISLGIIGEYIARIYEEVKLRPRYVVSGAIDNTADPETAPNA